MSLNFFLTEPYLTLAISKTDDVIAFIALAACGLYRGGFRSAPRAPVRRLPDAPTRS